MVVLSQPGLGRLGILVGKAVVGQNFGWGAVGVGRSALLHIPK